MRCAVDKEAPPERLAPNRRFSGGRQQFIGCPRQPIGWPTMTTPASQPTSTPAGTASSESGEYTHAQILTIITGLMMGMFLGALDQTIVSTAIRTIADDLHGLSVQAWVTTAYLITSTITTPIYGKLSDLFGRRPLFIVAITIFLIGSLAAGFAQDMY